MFISEGAYRMGSWIDQELAGCEFAYVRIGKRFGMLMKQLSKGLGQTLPQVGSRETHGSKEGSCLITTPLGGGTNICWLGRFRCLTHDYEHLTEVLAG